VTDPTEPKKGLNQFTKDVLYSSLVSITAKALLGAVVLLFALMVALVVADWHVPAWTLVAMALVAVALMYATKRVAGREAHELRPKLDGAEDELDRHDSYGRNICSVLDTFQKIVAKDIKMSMAAFIEQGILVPGRDVMQENGCSTDLRMSILIPSDGHFLMVWPRVIPSRRSRSTRCRLTKRSPRSHTRRKPSKSGTTPPTKSAGS
jgi:hypothetical protein